MKKKRIKYSNVVLFSLIILLVILFTITGIMVYNLYKDTLGKKNNMNGVEVLDTMNNIGYHLTENHTKYYKELYYELKKMIDKDKYDDEEYAKLISKMFVADFYDLNSKLNKTDVGGVQFIYSPYKETFKSFATDSTGIYYYVENNIYGDRKQKLPIVKEVEVKSIEKTSFEHDKVKDEEAYKVNISITYEENLGYQNNVELILIHVKDKIEIVEMN